MLSRSVLGGKVGKTLNTHHQAQASSRRLDIQGLRAVAVLMVVGYHAGLPIPGGFVGVDVFFVISGFVITAMLVREIEQSGKIRLGTFYVRRFKRLIPALAVMVAATMLVAPFFLFTLHGQLETAKTGLAAMLFTANIMIAQISSGYFNSVAESNPLLHTWSLSVEEQFYFVFPLALVLALAVTKRRSHRSRRLALTIVVAFMGVVSYAVMMAGVLGIEIPHVPSPLIGFFAASTRTWEFAAGALLALSWNWVSNTPLTKRSANACAVVGSAALLASLWAIDSSTPWPSSWTLLPVAGTLLLITAGASGNSVISGALASRFMTAIGDRSYSIYLWHWPFIVYTHIIWSPSVWILMSAALISLIPAYASYRWIERPLRVHKASRGWPLARFVSATVGPVLVLSGLVLVSAKNDMLNPTQARFAAQLRPDHLTVARGCFSAGWEGPEHCTWNHELAGPPIYLVGDSNADQFSAALLKSSTELSRPFVSLARQACPHPNTWPEKAAQYCEPFSTIRSDFLAQTESTGIVVLSSAWWKYFFEDWSSLKFPTGTYFEKKRQLFHEQLSASILELQESGHTVVLVQTVPHWELATPPLNWVTCSVVRLARDGCIQTMPLNAVSQEQNSVANMINTIAAETGAHVIDVSKEVCPESVCTTVRDDGLLPFRDSVHITVAQSEALAPAFTRELERVINSSGN